MNVVVLWMAFEHVQFAISRTFFVCDDLVVLLLAQFLDYIVPLLSELGRNLATWKQRDLPKPCPVEDNFLIPMFASNVNQNSDFPEQHRKSLNFITGSSKSKIFIDQTSDVPPSGKSVVLLNSLLFDTNILPEICLLIVAPLQR